MFVISHNSRFQVYRRGNCIGVVKYSCGDRKWYAQVYQCGKKWNDFVRELASWVGETAGKAIAPMHRMLMRYADFPLEKQRRQLPPFANKAECLKRVHNL
ncbi:hypothetical protein [Nostoc sp.]